MEAPDTDTARKRNLARAVVTVAQRLGNTPTICRTCYVHPAIVDAYLDGVTIQTLCERVDDELADRGDELPPDEAAVLDFLRQRLQTSGLSDGK